MKHHRQLFDPSSEKGIALVLAIFVLVMLTGAGLVLMAISRNALMMSHASLQNERAFFVSEAGLERGRAALLADDGSVDANASLALAAGSNGVFDFDPQAIRPVHDPSGQIVGFEGFGDDVPLIGATALDGALYMAFLTNDPEEGAGAAPLVDEDGRLVVYGVGSTPSGSLEIVKGVVEPEPLLPSMPPCTIMMLGPSPDFYPGSGDCSTAPEDDEDEDADDEIGGDFFDLSLDEVSDEDEDEDADEISSNKTFWGTDCGGTGGEAGHYVPVICVQGCDEPDASDEDEDEDADWSFFGLDPDEDEDEDFDEPPSICADTVVEAAISASCPNRFISGPYTGADTIADMNDAANEPTMGPDYEIDPRWTSCGALQELLADAREMADFFCVGVGCSMTGAGWDGGFPPTTTPSTLTFVDGDLDVAAGYAGQGLLFVTGTLSLHASASWSGPMIIVGEGRFIRTGYEGFGLLSGAAVMADIAGDDGRYGTADDCQGGFGTATYYEAERELADTQYCSEDLEAADLLKTYDLVQFRQY